MRICVLLLLALTFPLPRTVFAKDPQQSTLLVARPVVAAGQTESITVTARDLVGKALVGAAVSASIRYGTRRAAYTLPATDHSGRSSLDFTPPAGVATGKGTIAVTISNGYLEISLTGSFLVRNVKARQPKKAPTSIPAPTGVPVPPPTVKTQLLVVARALPPSVIAPAPIWLVVYVRSKTGVDRSNAPVDAAAVFKQGVARASGLTDAHGVATLKIDTNSAKSKQTVQVGVVVRWRTDVASTVTQFTVLKASKPGPFATPTATHTAAPTSTSTSTPTTIPLPTSTDVPPTPTLEPPQAAAVPTDTPTVPPVDTPTGTAVPLPSQTALRTATPIPTATASPTISPTPTSIPTATATPTNTPTPTPTITPNPNCPGSEAACMQAALDLINQTRADYHVGPLALNPTQSKGTRNCVGAYGHSMHMAETNVLAHDQFPADICVPGSHWGENIGEFTTGNELQDLTNMHQLMMSEQHDAAFCSRYNNHACNILSPLYSSVGIGIYVKNGTTWLTTDFIG